MTPCEHVWKRTGMFLMKMGNVYGSYGICGRRVVGGLEGYADYQTPEVECCEACGLLRIPSAPKTSEGSG